LQKELDAATRKAEQGVSRHRDEVQKLPGASSVICVSRSGVLQGNLDALRTANARTSTKWRRRVIQRDQLALSLDACRCQAAGASSEVDSEVDSRPAQEQWASAHIAAHAKS